MSKQLQSTSQPLGAPQSLESLSLSLNGWISLELGTPDQFKQSLAHAFRRFLLILVVTISHRHTLRRSSIVGLLMRDEEYPRVASNRALGVRRSFTEKVFKSPARAITERFLGRISKDDSMS